MFLSQNFQRGFLLFTYIIIFSIAAVSSADDLGSLDANADADWAGPWFPSFSKNAKDNNPTVQNIHEVDEFGRPMMGVPDLKCDDGKTNLTIDWRFNPSDFICTNYGKIYAPKNSVRPIYTREFIPKGYIADHKCMNESIEYKETIPTFGPHRPLWGQYGEYIYLPKQRWLHNLEHGAIVMLYHTCADRNEVNLLRTLVTSCLYRHIITPFNLLTPERPLALVAWGHRMEMSKVSPKVVIEFIKRFAKKGHEHTSRDGQFKSMFLKHAKIVTDIDDTRICPNF